jgi:predicted PurR-regulated permease PerM
LATVISSALGTFFNFLGYVLLILIITIFLLSGQLKIAQKIEKAFDSERAKQIILLIKTIQRRVQTYLIAKTFIGLMTAVVGTVMILLFGVDFAIVAGLLIFILDFIPNIGSTIATIFPLLICFVQYGYSWKLPLLALCLIANQMFFSNLVSPMLMGRGLNLSPLVIILSLIFWGWVWGIVGMILAVPLTSTLVIIFENIETLKPIAVLMSGSSAKSGKKGLEQRK